MPTSLNFELTLVLLLAAILVAGVVSLIRL